MKKRKIFSALAALLVLGAVDTAAEAAKLDAYRAMVEQNSFTLRYEQKNTKKELSESEGYLYNGEILPIVNLQGSRPEQVWDSLRGTVVASGADRYAETIYAYGKQAFEYMQGKEVAYSVLDGGEYGEHFLKKGKEKFYYISSFAPAFTLFGKGKPKWSYYGSMGKYGYSAKIEAGVCMKGAERAMQMEADDCNEAAGRFLAALCPNEVQTAYYAPPAYYAAGDGRLDDGRFYEDYAAEAGERRYMMRCYFDGNALTQVAMASFAVTADGAVDETSRSAQILSIKMFSSEPDTSCFALPKELKDVTKREKKDVGV